MKKRLFFLFTLGFAVLASGATWVLNPDVLEERLPLGVTSEELVRALGKEGIEIRFETQEARNLWKGNRTSISLSPTPFAPYHLWIDVEGRKTLDECTADELAALYGSVWKARKALGEVMSPDSFMIFTTEEKRNGKGSASVGMEIIPYGFGGSGGIMDVVEKQTLNSYLFYNHFRAKKVDYPPETLMAIQEKLAALQPFVPEEEPEGLWTQKMLRHTEALHQNLEVIRNRLVETGIFIEGELPPLPAVEEQVHEIQIDLDRCAFCNPAVIAKQLICEWKSVYILLGHKPFSPHGNFLILPKRHQCAWDLTDQEAIDSFEAVIGLKKMFSEMMGLTDWVCYIQDGPAAGQTVPHTHIHFMVPSDPLKLAISGLQQIHNERPILPYEKMRSECERIKPLLMAQLDKNL